MEKRAKDSNKQRRFANRRNRVSRRDETSLRLKLKYARRAKQTEDAARVEEITESVAESLRDARRRVEVASVLMTTLYGARRIQSLAVDDDASIYLSSNDKVDVDEIV